MRWQAAQKPVWTQQQPGHVEWHGAVTCCFLSQHRARPKGFEPFRLIRSRSVTGPDRLRSGVKGTRQ
jgi:hypothetical protein